MKEKLTAKDLLAKKDIIRERMNAKITLDTELGEITFRMPTREDIMDSQAYTNPSGADKSSEFLIYSTILEPDLRDAELQAEFLDKGEDPMNIVNKVFLAGEVVTVAMTLLNESGYSDESVKVVREVKN